MSLNGLTQKGCQKWSILETYKIISTEWFTCYYLVKACIQLEQVLECLKMSFRNLSQCMKGRLHSSTLLKPSDYLFALFEKIRLQVIVLVVLIEDEGLIQKIRATSNIDQNRHFSEKRATEFHHPLSPFLGVLRQNNALHNFHKKGSVALPDT